MMTDKISKILYIIFVFIFIVGFSGIGIAAIFNKPIAQKVVVTAPAPTLVPTSPNSNPTISINPQTSTPPPAVAVATLTSAVVSQHNSSNDCWIILAGSVYDISSYTHSGGSSHIQCGTDQDSALSRAHGAAYAAYFSSYLVGVLGSRL